MKNTKCSIIALITLFLFFSCQNKRSKEIERVIKEMQGKEIRFPNNFKGNDTRNSLIFDKENKLIVYIDTTGCTECKMRLREWKSIIEYAHDSLPNLSIIFIVVPKMGDSKNTTTIFKKYRFNYPFFIDSLDLFGELNRLPTDKIFHTFLINSHNKIVLTGSPIGNDTMWKLYKDYIRKLITNSDAIKEIKKNCNVIRTLKTKILIKTDHVNLGRFSIKKNRKIPFYLKNNGKQPFIISSINTSCGCTTAKYDNKPIMQGKTTTVILEYKPNSLGYFSKTADVVCNVPEGYVRLKISGEVVEK